MGSVVSTPCEVLPGESRFCTSATLGENVAWYISEKRLPSVGSNGLPVDGGRGFNVCGVACG